MCILLQLHVYFTPVTCVFYSSYMCILLQLHVNILFSSAPFTLYQQNDALISIYAVHWDIEFYFRREKCFGNHWQTYRLHSCYTLCSDRTWSETTVRSRHFWIVCSWVWGWENIWCWGNHGKIYSILRLYIIRNNSDIKEFLDYL